MSVYRTIGPLVKLCREGSRDVQSSMVYYSETTELTIHSDCALSIVILVISQFSNGIWILIVPVPNHCSVLFTFHKCITYIFVSFNLQLNCHCPTSSKDKSTIIRIKKVGSIRLKNFKLGLLNLHIYPK